MQSLTRPVSGDLDDSLARVARKAVPPGVGDVGGEDGELRRPKLRPIAGVEVKYRMAGNPHNRPQVGNQPRSPGSGCDQHGSSRESLALPRGDADHPALAGLTGLTDLTGRPRVVQEPLDRLSRANVHSDLGRSPGQSGTRFDRFPQSRTCRGRSRRS